MKKNKRNAGANVRRDTDQPREDRSYTRDGQEPPARPDDAMAAGPRDEERAGEVINRDE